MLFIGRANGRMHEDLWTLRQLERLAEREPGSFSDALVEILDSRPELREQIVIGAAEEDQISLAQAAERLDISVEALASRVNERRRSNGTIIDPEGGPNGPRLRSSGVAVWEIAREARRHGSLDGLAGDFPSIPRHELEAAHEYAESHPEQMDSLIERYESLFARRTTLG